MRIETAVLVHDEHAGQLAAGGGRPDQVALHRSRALRRRVVDALRLQPLVVGCDLLRLDELRAESLQQHRRGDAAHRELRGAVQEAATVDRRRGRTCRRDSAVPDRNHLLSCAPCGTSCVARRSPAS